MKNISTQLLSKTVIEKRKGENYTQEELGNKTGINRQIVGRIETGKFIPSISQLNSLMDVLNFGIEDILEEEQENVFVALRGEAKTEGEKEWVDKMLSMMLTLRKHSRLQKSFGER